MRIIKLFSITLLLLCLTFGTMIGCDSDGDQDEELAQDAAVVAPDSYKVLLDNDRVRVLEYQIKPGKKDAMHSHPAYIVFSITPGKFMFTLPDGKTMVRELKAGGVMFLEAETHSTENMGAEANGLIIELKEPQKK